LTAGITYSHVIAAPKTEIRLVLNDSDTGKSFSQEAYCPVARCIINDDNIQILVRLIEHRFNAVTSLFLLIPTQDHY